MSTISSAGQVLGNMLHSWFVQTDGHDNIYEPQLNSPDVLQSTDNSANFHWNNANYFTVKYTD